MSINIVTIVELLNMVIGMCIVVISYYAAVIFQTLINIDLHRFNLN